MLPRTRYDFIRRVEMGARESPISFVPRVDWNGDPPFDSGINQNERLPSPVQ
jgi:hypothetical protein